MSKMDPMHPEHVLSSSVSFALMLALRLIRKGTPVQQITDQQRSRMASVIITQLRQRNVRIEVGPPVGPPDTFDILQIPRGPPKSKI